MKRNGGVKLAGTVMIVDDSDSERELVSQYITTSHPDLELLEAANGPTALQMMTSHQIDLIILDYRLPVVDGLEVLKHLVKDYDVPVIMITGMGSQEVAVEALNIGAVDYVTKSIGYHKGLPMLVERHLLQARQSQQQHQLEVQYEALVEHSQDPIYQLMEGKFVYVNKAFEELFGYLRAEVVAPDFSMLDLLTPISKRIVVQRAKDLEAGKELPSLYQFSAVTREGREVELETNVSYILQPDGSYLTQGILREISDRPAVDEPDHQPETTPPVASPTMNPDEFNELNNHLAYVKANLIDIGETLQMGQELIEQVKAARLAPTPEARELAMNQLEPILAENDALFTHSQQGLETVQQGLTKIGEALKQEAVALEEVSEDPANVEPEAVARKVGFTD